MDDDDAMVLAGYDELVGRVVRPGRRLTRARPAINAARNLKLQKMASDLPSASGRVMRQFLGWPLFTFTNTSGTSIQQTTRPQRSIQLDRVIATAGRSVATLLQILVVTKFKIGAEDMLSGNDAIPLDMFVATATSARFKGYTAKAGIDCVVTIQVVGAALGAGESINVSLGGYGDAVAG